MAHYGAPYWPSWEYTYLTSSGERGATHHDNLNPTGPNIILGVPYPISPYFERHIVCFLEIIGSLEANKVF